MPFETYPSTWKQLQNAEAEIERQEREIKKLREKVKMAYYIYPDNEWGEVEEAERRQRQKETFVRNIAKEEIEKAMEMLKKSVLNFLIPDPHTGYILRCRECEGYNEGVCDLFKREFHPDFYCGNAIPKEERNERFNQPTGSDLSS